MAHGLSKLVGYSKGAFGLSIELPCQKDLAEHARDRNAQIIEVEAPPAVAALLIVDEVDQLPSGGPGQVLTDSIASGVVRCRWSA